MHGYLLPDVHLFGLTGQESKILMATWVAMAVAISGFLFAVRRVSTIPSGLSSFVEYVHDELSDLMAGIMGPRGRAFLPLIVGIFFFIFAANYVGLVPGMIAPTSNLNTPLALALVVFSCFVIVGIRVQGPVGYLRHLLGPVLFLAPLMLVIEIVSLLSRPFSLTLRLFANILVGEQIIGVLGTISGYVVAPVVWMVWEGLITGWIQPAVFSILAMIYIGEVLSHRSEERHGAEAA